MRGPPCEQSAATKADAAMKKAIQVLLQLMCGFHNSSCGHLLACIAGPAWPAASTHAVCAAPKTLLPLQAGGFTDESAALLMSAESKLYGQVRLRGWHPQTSTMRGACSLG